MSNKGSKQYATFLAKVPFFTEVSKSALKEFGKSLDSEKYDRHDTIFEQGESGEAMYVIIEGKVKVHNEKHVYDHLTSGDCFGEYAMIDNEDRSASITAVEPTELLKIERHHFLDLMKKDSGFAQGILSVMIRRHRELDVIQENLADSKKMLELANSKMTGLIECAMDAIIMFDSKFKIVLTNPSANRLLENEDAVHRNFLFFLDEKSAEMIESIVQTSATQKTSSMNSYLPEVVKVIGSDETATLNEGTISRYGDESESFYTLILRNIEERVQSENTINLLTTQTEYLQEEINELTSNYGIIAEAPNMMHLLNQVEQVAKTTASVLIHGETGTGKELVARAIHEASHRADQPLIRINCGAIPSNLIESELFGHEKGAFTGATASRKGRFLLADKGTIFLDEIGELPLELQPKLLRVLQEGEFDPVGSSETHKVDVRIISATNRDLLKFAKEGKFREDLYYRLNVFPLEVPALRERGDDIVRIADTMIARYASMLNKKAPELSELDKGLLLEYNWPGNVRELQNLIERAIIISQRGKIDWASIIPSGGNAVQKKPSSTKSEVIYSLDEMMEMEKQNILRALKRTGWRVSGNRGAAILLQIPPTTLASKMKALGISRPQ